MATSNKEMAQTRSIKKKQRLELYKAAILHGRLYRTMQHPQGDIPFSGLTMAALYS